MLLRSLKRLTRLIYALPSTGIQGCTLQKKEYIKTFAGVEKPQFCKNPKNRKTATLKLITSFNVARPSCYKEYN